MGSKSAVTLGKYRKALSAFVPSSLLGHGKFFLVRGRGKVDNLENACVA